MPANRLAAVLLLLALTGCQHAPRAPEAAPPLSESAGLRWYQAEGFALQLPAGAVVEVVDVPDSGALAAVRIQGPELALSPAGEAWRWQGPAYQLEVIAFDNPDGVGVEQWIRRHVRSSGESVTLAGRPAVQTRTFAGDSEAVTLYTAEGRRVVALRYTDWPVGNSPIASLQRDLHTLLASTLRLTR